MQDIWENYSCDGQMELEQWLWESGYYMALPVEDKNGEDKNIEDDEV